MTLTIDLPPDVEGALTDQARRQGVTPESLVVENLRRLYKPGPVPEIAPEQPGGAALSPTAALFQQWEREDATDDPEEIARRTREGDELLAALAQNSLTLRRVDLSDWPDDDSDTDTHQGEHRGAN